MTLPERSQEGDMLCLPPKCLQNVRRVLHMMLSLTSLLIFN